MSPLSSLFELPPRVPHGFCLAWDPELLWLHAGSDTVILLSYLSIPASLIWLLRRRRDRTYRWVGYLFVLFIIACATTHGLDVVTLWIPAYAFQGAVKAMTAVASVSTAAVLWIMAPRLAAMLSPIQLTSLNDKLSSTVSQQDQTLGELRDAEQQLRSSLSALQRELTGRANDLRKADTMLRQIKAERAHTNEMLAKSIAEYQASFASPTIGKIQIEPLSGHLVRANGAFAAMLGYEVDSLIGRPIWDLAYPDDRTAARAQFDKLLLGEIDHWASQSRMVRRDGVPTWVRISASVVIDPAIGLPRLAVADVEDLEVRHDIQAALRVTEMRLRQALERLQIGIVELDIHGGLFWVSHQTASMSGGEIPAETWLALNGSRYLAWTKRVHPDDRDRRTAQLRALHDGKSDTVTLEYRASRADGLWTNLLHRYAVVEHDPATGAPTRAVGIVSDESDRIGALKDAQTARAAAERAVAQRDGMIAHRRLLLREIYHRMTAALQVASALLGDQACTAEQSGLRQKMWAQRGRIAALGVVHRELMIQLETMAITVDPMLHDLADTILVGPDDRTATALPKADVETSHREIAVGQVIPLCLLAAELLIGCAAYFSPSGTAPIALCLRRAPDATIELILTAPTARDGADPGIAIDHLKSQPIRDLLAQLDASLDVSTVHGLEVRVSFQDQASAPPDRSDILR